VSETDSAVSTPTARGPAASDAIEFLEALRSKVEERQADGGNLAVLLIECGVISRIDAVWGYHVGDAVRSRVTASLRTDVLRPGDFVGEMGRPRTFGIRGGVTF
jgi:GGDEF domain-containing protein